MIKENVRSARNPIPILNKDIFILILNKSEIVKDGDENTNETSNSGK